MNEDDKLIDQIISGIHAVIAYYDELRSAAAIAATNSDARRFLEHGREWRERELRTALRQLIEMGRDGMDIQ